MSAVLEIGFENFKRLSKDKRIYYYIGENHFEFYFVSESMVIKSSLLKTEVGIDLKQFFSDPMFYGAMQLKFQIPTPKVNPIESITSEPVRIAMADELVNLLQPEEVKQTNIQREGVEMNDA